MSIKINSNPASLRAIQQLAKNTTALRTTQERLSSGLRINKASDDAAGLGIAMSLNARSRVYTQGVRNINDATSLLNIASSAVDALSSIVTRQIELAEQAANGTYTSKQRQALDKEARALSDEYNRLMQSTEFNGRYLFRDGPTQVQVQAGYGESGVLSLDIGSKIASGVIGNGLFGTLNLEPISGVPIGALAADVNNDGKMDYLRSDNNSVRTVVYLGNGDGSFQTGIARTWPQALYPVVAAVDIDNDGNLDMIGTRETTGMAIYKGNGDGTFQAGVEYAGDGGYGVGSGDFNGDGWVDIITSSGPAGQLDVWLNDQDGTFSAGTSIANSARQVSIADFNEDGKLDFILSGIFQDGGNSVYLGNGDGTFVVNPGGTVDPANGQTTEAHDLDRDGHMDFLSVNALGDIYAVLGDGNGNFTTQSITSSGLVGAPGLASYMTDNNKDGFMDVTVMNSTSIKTYHNDGHGNFTLAGESQAGLTSGSIGGIAVGDFNGDNVSDIIWDELGTGDRYMYLADTTPGSLQQDLDLTTQDAARETLTLLNNTLSSIHEEKGVLGAQSSRLETARNVLATTAERFKAAESIILDADIAEEAANLVRLSIAQRIAGQVLAQANLQPQLVLKLLKED